MLRQGKSLRRYTGQKFEDRQSITKPARIALLPVLGLNPGDETWFEMPTKKSPEEFTSVSELGDIENLKVVHFVEKEDEPTPVRVLDRARGTIIWKDSVIVRHSIPYREDVVMDELRVSNGTVTFPFKLNPRIIHQNDLFIRPYHEGTVLSLMKLNGVVQWFTARNLLPKGVKIEGQDRWIHQPGKWGERSIPFTTSFTNIAKVADPNLLKDDVLFPKDCKFSNREYRFIITTRQKVRADADPVGPIGYLTYLGCFEQWSNNNPPALLAKVMGTPHTDDKVYHPKCVTRKPVNINEPFIIEYTTGLTTGQATDYLQGTGGIFGGGGKLVVTGKVRGRSGAYNEITFHVKSTAYQHREEIMGNDEILYHQFLANMNVRSYDFEDPDSLRIFADKFPSLALPGVNSPIGTVGQIKEMIEREQRLPVMFKPDQLIATITGSLARLVWYNFLLCTNVSVRDQVYTYLQRYVHDLEGATGWLLTVGKETDFEKLRKPDQKSDIKVTQQIRKYKDFIFTTKRAITQHRNYKRGNVKVNAVILQSIGNVEKTISIYHKMNPDKARESIRKTEPSAKFKVSTTYQSITTGEAGKFI